MKIVYKKGSCVDKKVDTIFNSANSFLLYGSGTAGDI